MTLISRRMALAAVFAPLLPGADDTAWIQRLGGKVRRDPAGMVTAVDLGTTPVNDAELLDLLAFRKLETLDLSHTRISDEGLLRLKPAAQIRELSLLYAEQITDLGVSAIKQWHSLRSLNLRGTRISDETLVLVGALDRLESLDIANTSVTDSGLDNLVSLTRIKSLALGRNRLGDGALSVLRVLTTLESLDLGGPRGVNRNQRGKLSAPLDDSLVAAMAELKELRVLKLGYTEIDQHGLRRLAALPKVEKLGLESCRRIDDAALAELKNWKALRFLDLQETAVTRAGVARLQADRPEVRILSGPFAAETRSE